MQVGGLGDVVTALGRAMKESGHQVEVILPRYEFFSHSPLLGGAQVGGGGQVADTCMSGAAGLVFPAVRRAS